MNTNSILKKQCDILFSKIVRSRGVCQLRGLDLNPCSGPLECCHIVPRGNLRLRYDLKNALSCCREHHAFYTNHPSLWYEIIEKNFAENNDYLMENRNTFEKPRFAHVLERLKKYDI